MYVGSVTLRNFNPVHALDYMCHGQDDWIRWKLGKDEAKKDENSRRCIHTYVGSKISFCITYSFFIYARAGR